MKRKTLALALTLLILALVTVELGSIKLALATSDESFPSLSMPIEYVNYTITTVDGSLWAMVDGDYPIYVSSHPDYGSNGELPIVYPMPPNSTNIHLYLDGEELSWTNYAQIYPDQLHHTAIGEWWMIYSVLSNVSGFFELKIHYEHPLQTVNGRNLFLYDLNINPYLSPQNNNSTCIYTIQFDANITDFQAYTAETDDKWNPIDFTTIKEGAKQTIFINEYSEYAKPLLGDLIVEFSLPSSKQTPPSTHEYNQTTTVAIFLGTLTAVIAVSLLIFFKKQKPNTKQLTQAK